VRRAVELQRGMALRNDGVPKERRIEFRIGINLGDIISDEHDIYGDGVNVAARLEALAEPGGICVSRVVRDQVRDKVDFGFEDLGARQVKNQSGVIHRWEFARRGEEFMFDVTGPLTLDEPALVLEAALAGSGSWPRSWQRAVLYGFWRIGPRHFPGRRC
jgi:adenylate/guanylate cyclase family protein